ncbi:hypothetical protein AB0F88_41880 [Streptosporangium sp. NPDC023963]|uniref:hypothetical protein n=1 Tax=Streptosporangium sp. NPDC023963 TaxID=3155608 RepID=UPI003436E573
MTPVPVLRRLYLARFGFALVWAGLLALTLPDLGVAAGVLLVVYPAVDAAAAIVDVRATPATRARSGVYGTIAAGSLAAVGLAVASLSGVPAALRVWGAWAVVAGLLQLVVAVLRRGTGGQVAMILSGGGSVVAGTAFVLIASTEDPTLSVLAGYAVVGGTFFLISALRLRAAAGLPGPGSTTQSPLAEGLADHTGSYGDR